MARPKRRTDNAMQQKCMRIVQGNVTQDNKTEHYQSRMIRINGYHYQTIEENTQGCGTVLLRPSSPGGSHVPHTATHS